MSYATSIVLLFTFYILANKGKFLAFFPFQKYQKYYLMRQSLFEINDSIENEINLLYEKYELMNDFFDKENAVLTQEIENARKYKISINKKDKITIEEYIHTLELCKKRTKRNLSKQLKIEQELSQDIHNIQEIYKKLVLEQKGQQENSDDENYAVKVYR